MSMVGGTEPSVAAADEEGEDEGDEGDDDDSSDLAEEEEEDEEADKTQPLVTAGGLFTLRTYPVRELFRPLTMTEKILQTRIGLGIDVSARGAFEQYGLNLDAKYGFRDHVTGLIGFNNAYNFKGFTAYAGGEFALAYDFIDVRAVAKVYRPANATPDEVDPNEITYTAGKPKFSIDLGFPFRYTATKEIAIIALDTFITFDFNDANDNDVKPDLNPSLGIATNPIEAISIVMFAQLQVVDFDTSADEFVIPATARIQFSPNQRLDLGAEFTFLNLNEPEPLEFYDNRFLLLYGQVRIGR